MATAVHPAMNMTPFNAHQNQCIDPDHEFFDFGSLPSPSPATLKREASVASSITSPISTALDEDLQQPAKPSHEYERFKQHTGLPMGSIAGLGTNYNASFANFSSTGMDDLSFMTNDSILDGSWSTGLNMDSSMNMGLEYDQSNFFVNDASQDDFNDPSAITQEEVPNVRVWPGMHQQAALAKAQAQAQAQQQRQQQQQQLALQKQQQAIQAQHQHRLSISQPSRKSSSPLSDARTEETIARVVAQIRADSQNASSMQDAAHGLLPHVIRAKKDEDDMDEDERLLASEEGKKLSSKERRQLRNKVSARAFRSRRKEYIGQLEGDIAAKVNEANDLRTQNRLMMEENARSRAFIERLLRHQAFTPFLEELSRDEALQSKAPITTASAPVATPAPASFQSQQFGGMSQAESTHVGMTMVPETQVDFSMLNLNTNNNNNNTSWGNGGFSFQQPRVFAVLELPEGPADPLDAEAMSGKVHRSIFEESSPVDEVKPDYPAIERPVESKVTVAIEEVEEEDSEYDLYNSSPAPSASTSVDNHETLFTNPEKALAHFSLIVSDEASEALLADRLERRIAAMEPALQRLAAITSTFDL